MNSTSTEKSMADDVQLTLSQTLRLITDSITKRTQFFYAHAPFSLCYHGKKHSKWYRWMVVKKSNSIERNGQHMLLPRLPLWRFYLFHTLLWLRSTCWASWTLYSQSSEYNSRIDSSRSTDKNKIFTNDTQTQ